MSCWRKVCLLLLVETPCSVIVDTTDLAKLTICLDEHPLTELEQDFDNKVPEEGLKFFLSLIQRLMRFTPSDRISASQAFEEVKREVVACNLRPYVEGGT